MQLLYLDESGDPGWGPPHGKSPFTWFVLAGLSLPDNMWRESNERYRTIVRKYFGVRTNDFDMKYSALTAGRSPYDVLSGQERFDLANDIFDLILDIEPTLFAIVVNKINHKREYGTHAYNPKRLALRFIAPRFHKYLIRVDDYGLFVMDEEEKKSDRRLKKLIQDSREQGIVLQTLHDPYRTDTKLPRIVESILFVPSGDCSGIALADFCSHSIWLKYQRNLRRRYDQIKHLFDRVGGDIYGLKEWLP